MDMEQIGSDIKSLFKNKKFVTLCVIVGMVALILWIVKQNRMTTTTETDDYYDGSQAIGYGGYGYPYAGDSSALDSEWFLDILEGYNDNWTSMFEGLEDRFAAIDDRFDALAKDDDTGGDNYSGGGYISGGSSSGSTVDEQAIIDAMEANSNAWWDVADQSGRDSLHAENEYLGSMIGAQYDSQTGLWYKDGLPLYSVDKGDAMSYVTGTGKKPLSTGSAGYVTNIDYQAAINEGVANGTVTADQVNQLYQMRENKIASTGIGSTVSYDPNTDYAALINKGKEMGVSQSVIDGWTASRNAKIEDQKKKSSTTAKQVAQGKSNNMTK